MTESCLAVILCQHFCLHSFTSRGRPPSPHETEQTKFAIPLVALKSLTAPAQSKSGWMQVKHAPLTREKGMVFLLTSPPQDQG